MKPSGTVELETPRLRLRRFRPEDAADCLLHWAADGAVFQYISQAPMTRQEAENFLSGAEEAYANPETWYWAIERREISGVIGRIFVDDFSRRSGWCEVDYQLGSAFWGRGYAPEALRAVIAYLFNGEGFHRIQAKCSVQNTASERVMQKVGMEREGILREFFRRKTGPGWDDVVLYAIINRAGTFSPEKITNR